MTGHELQRRARGRARKKRLARHRSRIIAFGILALSTFGIMANTAVDFVDEKVRVIENRRVIEYVPPQLPLVVSQAEQSKPAAAQLPPLLNLDELFPTYRDKHAEEPKPRKREVEEPEEVALLDDLGAAPPKALYLEAVFQGGLEVIDGARPVRLSQDFIYSTVEWPLSGGGPLPSIPEPSTGILLGLGLIGLSVGSRARARRSPRRAAVEAELRAE
jgi:hypothetical protein